MEVVINVKMPQYLRQWWANEQGGEPVRLLKGAVESKLLEVYLTRPPRDYVPEPKGEDEVAVCLPQFRGKDTACCNYLPLKARQLLAGLVHKRFVVALWGDLHQLGTLGLERKGLIRAWMQSHGIEYSGTNWDAIEKNYMRAQNAYRQNCFRKSKKRGRKIPPAPLKGGVEWA